VSEDFLSSGCQMMGCAGYTLGRGATQFEGYGGEDSFPGSVAVATLPCGSCFHLRRSGCGGEVVVFIRSVVYAMAAMRPNAI